jgi:hypothetical protein
MSWTPDRWPPAPADPIDAAVLLGDAHAALAERNALVPAGMLPEDWPRWAALRGTPGGGDPDPVRTVANLQRQVADMLTLAWPLRWWDDSRTDLYTLENLCQDAFGSPGWTWDLAAEDGQGLPANSWSPAAAAVFGELYAATNRLDSVRVLPSVSEAVRHDSVARLTFGVTDWDADRADTFALFDGADDGASASPACDAGLVGEVADDGYTQAWSLESRRFRMEFATAALAGATVRRAWLDFSTEAPAGQADYEDTFTAHVTDAAGTPLDTFASDDYGAKRVEVPAGSVRTDSDTVLEIRSTRTDTADRAAWSPAGPNFTSTYREGLAVTGPVRLIVEIDFAYRA